MTQEEMNILVPKKLREIEEKYCITVLYAAESGSRAWGFASPDSDFDVRFIYKRPQTEYLRLDPVRDVIELPQDDTWDVSGWDLDKTLRLLRNANPALYDWIGSPICYRDMGFKDRFVPLMRQCFSRERLMKHYHGIAKRHIEDVFDGPWVRSKKYFYALRSMLACLWVEENNEAPPVVFMELVDAMLPVELRPSWEYIMERKKEAPEKEEIEHVKDIDVFLKENLESADNVVRMLPKEIPMGWDALNAFFLQEIGI